MKVEDELQIWEVKALSELVFATYLKELKNAWAEEIADPDLINLLYDAVSEPMELVNKENGTITTEKSAASKIVNRQKGGNALKVIRTNANKDTLEKVYGIKDVLHLHGGIPSCCEIAPIMGHGNKYIIDLYRRKAKEAQEEYVEWYESICNAIADFCESLYKDTDAIISENDDFFSALRDVNQVVCLGLSFGDVDVPYLDRIEYEVRPETKWLVYYHSDEDLKRLKSVFGITGISRKFEVYFRKSDNFWDR